MRKSIALLVVILVSGCAGPHKPDTKAPNTKTDENWRIVYKTPPFPSTTLAADVLLGFTIWEIRGIIPMESWGVVEDVEPIKFHIQNIALAPFSQEGELAIGSREMRDRAALIGGDFGLVDAEYLLEHQADIPASWQNYGIVFPGTVLRNSSDNGFYVPVLICWIGGDWQLSFNSLDGDWGDRYWRVPRIKE